MNDCDGTPPSEANHEPAQPNPLPSASSSATGDWSARPSLIYQPGSYFQRLDLNLLFPRNQPLEVELGSGDGSFLAQYAALNPTHNFLGVERLLGRLRKIDRKSRRAGLSNVGLMRIEAGYFLEYLLPPKSVRALHVYFPDPWPKRKHRKNRLVNSRFTELAHQILEPAGVVHLRTDDADYFEQMTAAFREDRRFCETATPPALAAVSTDFERDFRARGIPSLTASYRHRDG